MEKAVYLDIIAMFVSATSSKGGILNVPAEYLTIQAAIAGDGNMEVTAVGELVSGQYFYGSDILKIRHR